MLIVALLIITPTLAIFSIVGLVIMAEEKEFKKKSRGLQERNSLFFFDFCPPVENPTEDKEIKKEIREHEHMLSVKEWVTKYSDLLLDIFEDKDLQEYVISEDLLKNTNASEIQKWLMSQFRVQFSCHREGEGIRLFLGNPRV